MVDVLEMFIGHHWTERPDKVLLSPGPSFFNCTSLLRNTEALPLWLSGKNKVSVGVIETVV